MYSGVYPVTLYPNNVYNVLPYYRIPPGDGITVSLLERTLAFLECANLLEIGLGRSLSAAEVVLLEEYCGLRW